jgi:V/A-type H+-transporting ATPase subunit G/H
VLLEVKQTEEKVEKLKANALQEKERIIKNSKRETLKILEDAKVMAQDVYRFKIDAINKEIEQIRTEIIGSGKKKADELKGKARQNIEKAVDLLVTKFENEVSNA